MTQRYPSAHSEAYSWSVGGIPDDSGVRVSASAVFPWCASHPPVLSWHSSQSPASFIWLSLAFGSAHKSSTGNHMWQVKAVLTFSVNGPLASGIYCSENNSGAIQVVFTFSTPQTWRSFFMFLMVRDFYHMPVLTFGGVVMSFSFPWSKIELY